MIQSTDGTHVFSPTLFALGSGQRLRFRVPFDGFQLGFGDAGQLGDFEKVLFTKFLYTL